MKIQRCSTGTSCAKLQRRLTGDLNQAANPTESKAKYPSDQAAVRSQPSELTTAQDDNDCSGSKTPGKGLARQQIAELLRLILEMLLRFLSEENGNTEPPPPKIHNRSSGASSPGSQSRPTSASSASDANQGRLNEPGIHGGGSDCGGNGKPFTDADGDGDADVNLYADERISKTGLKHVEQEIERASGGKIDVHIKEGGPGAAANDPNGVPINVAEFGGNKAGESGVGMGSSITIDSSSVADKSTLLHETMHAVGINGHDESGHAENPNSIMDYSYRGNTLTSFDANLLQELYAEYSDAPKSA